MHARGPCRFLAVLGPSIKLEVYPLMIGQQVLASVWRAACDAACGISRAVVVQPSPVYRRVRT
eukprot:2876642-Alexandrium_andersonii.AAC.1